MSKYIKKFFADQSGATLAEYGIALVVGIAVGGAALTALSGDINAQIGQVDGVLDSDGVN